MLETAEFVPRKRKLELLERLVAINQQSDTNADALKWELQRDAVAAMPDKPIFVID